MKHVRSSQGLYCAMSEKNYQFLPVSTSFLVETQQRIQPHASFKTDVNRTICALLSFCSPTPVWGEGWSTQGDWLSISKLDQCTTHFDPAAKCCRYKKQTVHKLYSGYDVTNVLFHPTLPAISWKSVFAVLYVSMLYWIN